MNCQKVEYVDQKENETAMISIYLYILNKLNFHEFSNQSNYCKGKDNNK